MQQQLIPALPERLPTQAQLFWSISIAAGRNGAPVSVGCVQRDELLDDSCGKDCAQQRHPQLDVKGLQEQQGVVHDLPFLHQQAHARCMSKGMTLLAPPWCQSYAQACLGCVRWYIWLQADLADNLECIPLI